MEVGSAQQLGTWTPQERRSGALSTGQASECLACLLPGWQGGKGQISRSSRLPEVFVAAPPPGF